MDAVRSQKYDFSGEFQRKIAALLLLDPTFLDEYRDAVDHRYFESVLHQALVERIINFYDRYRVKPTKEALESDIFDYATRVGMKDEDRTSILTTVSDVLSADLSDAQFVKDQIIRFARHQALKVAILDSVDVMEAAEKDPKKSLECVLPIFQKALAKGCSSDIGVEVFQNLGNIYALRENDHLADPRYKVRTGISSIDSRLNGGLGAGELGLVMGESGLGKSFFLVNMAANAVLLGKRTLYITLELKPYDVTVRALACMTKCTIEEVESNSAAFQEQAKKLSKLAGRYLRVKYLKPSQATPVSIRALLAKMEAVEGIRPELIVIDYVDEMRGTEQGTEENTYLAYGQITAELIEIGVDYRCPVWTATQINRTGYNNTPNLASTGESMKKVNKADLIIALDQKPEERELKRMRLVVLKIRRGGGRNLHIPVKADFERAKFREVASASNPDAGLTAGGVGTVGEQPAPPAADLPTSGQQS